jgi:hypothetical protein
MASNSGILIPPPASPETAAGTNDIRPIKPPVEVPHPWVPFFWAGGIVVLLGLVATGVILWLITRQRRAIVPPVPPHVRARLKIESALQLIGDPRAFAIAVSDAVRVYLEERFRLRAPERTTEEFLRDLQKTSALTTPQKLSLAAFLEQCDLVKFARFEPPETMLRELHESALRLVHETQYDPLVASATVSATPIVPPPLPSTATSGSAKELEKPQQSAGGTPP